MPQQTAEPDRKNYAVWRKDLCNLESEVAGRLAIRYSTDFSN